MLSHSDWKGLCRKVVNEAGKEINKRPYIRLQSVYGFDSGKLLWSVKSFKDSKCKTLYEVNKYTFECKDNLKDAYANCKQVKMEFSKDEKKWESKLIVDHAGYSNIMEIQVSAKLSRANEMELTTIGESGDPKKEKLHLGH